MSYADEDDVRRYLGTYAEYWTSSSVPSIDDGLKFVEQASGEIDGTLSARGIAVPVTEPAYFIQHLRDLSATFAAALIAKGFFNQSAGPESSTSPEFLMGIWNNGIAALRAGQGIPDGVPTTGGALPTSFHQQHPGSSSADFADRCGDTDPVMTRDMKW